MTFERTHDMELVREIITNPRIYDNVVDDFSPAREDYRPNDCPALVYLLVKDGDEVLGVVVFQMRTWIVWEIHPVMLPHACWTMRARPAILGAIDFIWSSTGCQRIVAEVPALKHRTKLRIPPKLGMEQYGVNPKSFMKDGKLADVHLFGISRPEAAGRSAAT